MSFIIYTAGRSRTKWLSEFLSYRDHRCHFELASQANSFADARHFLADEKAGTAETAAAPAWRLIHHYLPNLRRVVVFRPVDEIVTSLLATLPRMTSIDEDGLRRQVAYLVRCLAQIAELPGTLTATFADLGDEKTCRNVFEHCLQQDFDREWWLRLRDRNIQKNVLQFVLDLDCDRLYRLQRSCRAEFRALARSGALSKRRT
jgi:hypothetical protein